MGSSRTGRLDPQVKRHVDDLFGPLESVLAASEAVESLRAHPGWIHVESMLVAEAMGIDRRLSGGDDPHTQAQYAKWHGRLGGLGYVNEAMDAIVQRAEQRLLEQQHKHEGTPERAPEGAAA